ncbi:fucose 4-O-acetylase-like acetyltransferase [Bacillus mesophilus]|uniref:Acyltransferase family protein n=1 Tax=Bacillus mesophilus TaxID=1808955 RepID=A0A6M0Q7I6_9BACI|nr:acyltransferase family protein [Bacillus mesophilus]MBM7661608.1 fucose 4-O-acetylase-like acetyltransferase [Bacillus mesophilus]NEY72277.1 acyltransferase family protein [Bacillus mesophilus]
MNRLKWMDIAKGIGIILVVLGHSIPQIAIYIYWFHMPLFFFLSGYLHKQKGDFVSKKVASLLVPYVVYLLTLTLVRYLHYGVPSVKRIQLDMERFIFGGQELGGFYTVFWYITCLLFTSILFYVLLNFIKKESILLLTIIFSYIVSYYFSLYFGNIPTPWSIGVVPFALTFYYIGYKFNKIINIINNTYIFLVSISFSVAFLILNNLGVIHYKMNMKSQLFNHLGLDIVIPLTFILLTISCSIFISKIKYLQNIFSYLGNASLTIMYMHSFILILLPIYFKLPLGVNIMVSILVPLIWDSLLRNSNLINLLFNGRIYKRDTTSEELKNVA